MGFRSIISHIIGRHEQRSQPFAGADTLPPIFSFLSGGASDAGMVVTEQSATTVTAVYACVSILATAISALPLHVQRRKDGERLYDHPLYDLLHDRPNEYMDSPVWREAMQANALLWGFGYSFIERDDLGRPVGLYPLPSAGVHPYRQRGTLLYRVQIGTRSDFLAPADVLAIPGGITLDGITPMSPIRQGRQAIGLSMAAEKFAGKFFAAGGAMGGLIEGMPAMDKDALQDFLDNWRAHYAGVENAHRTGILPAGAKYHKVATDPEQGQMVDTRVHQVREVARLFRVPLHMLGDLEKSSYASVEAQAQEFLQFTVQPHIIRWEAQLNSKLPLERERREIELRFNVDALLRPSTRERYEAHAKATGGPFMTTNEARKREGLPPIPRGDELLRPLNHGTTGEPAASKPEDKPGDDAATRSAHVTLLEDAARRVLTKEARALQRAAKKHQGKPDEFRAWAEDFYRRHEPLVTRTLAAPLAAAGAGAGAGADVSEYAKRHCSASQEAALAAFTAGTTDDLCDEFETVRPREIAEELTTNKNNDTTKRGE